VALTDWIPDLRGTIQYIFRLGKPSDANSVQIKASGGLLQVRNSDDTAFAKAQGANPTLDDDLVTKRYADSLPKPLIVTAQISGASAVPANTGTRHFIAVTTTGVNANIGDLYLDDGTGSGNATKLVAVEGRTIVVTDNLSGGTVTLLADTMYVWDADGSAWVSASGINPVISYALTNAATQDSAAQVPANARVLRTRVQISTVFSAGGTISVGQVGSVSLLATTSQVDPQTTGIYEIPQETAWGGSALVVRVTVGGAPAAGAGRVTVEYALPAT